MVLSTVFLSACGGPEEIQQLRAMYFDTEFADFPQMLNKVRQQNLPIAIQNIGIVGPNSAGGVDVAIQAKNIGNKTIKYIDYWVTPYNAVGDTQRGEIGRQSTSQLEDTGPYPPNQYLGNWTRTYVDDVATFSGYWENVWYNHTIKCIVLNKYRVTYIDGSTKTVSNRSKVDRSIIGHMSYFSKEYQDMSNYTRSLGQGAYIGFTNDCSYPVK